MTSLSISPPTEISLSALAKQTHLIVRAHRLDDDPRPNFSARYRVVAIVRDAYHARDATLHVAKPGDEIQPLPPDVKAQEAASRHLSDLYQRGISASVCVQPSSIYHGALPEGERDCLLFLQPIVRGEKIAFMFAAYNSVETLAQEAVVQQALPAPGLYGLDTEVMLALQPPSYRVAHSYFDHLQDRNAAGAVELCHPDLHYFDPILGDLHGREALARWPIFFAQPHEPSLHFFDITAKDDTVHVRYFLHYTDAETGRKIDHGISAELTIRDNRITHHKDTFDIWRFATMKLGMRGRLLGFLPSTADALRKKARAELDAYLRQAKG